MSTNKHYDVVVIGGGAAGMMAAGRAAERGRRVVLLEKNKELGKKLSITGGGRCNILNAEPNSRALAAKFGTAAKFLHSPLSQHGMQDSWDFFTNRGLPLVVEARKRAFPQSMHAPDVTETMRQYLIQHRVEIKVDHPVVRLVVDAASGTLVQAVTRSGDVYTAEHFILATGGLSHQETGSTGESMEWLREMGYTVHAPNPNLVPLTSPDRWVHALSGTTLSFMKITFGMDRPKARAAHPGRFSRTGKILFTHFGISGPLVLNAAHEVMKLLQSGPIVVSVDMYPDTELGTIRNRVLEAFAAHKNKLVRTVLKDLTPAGMTDAVIAQLPPELAAMPVHSVRKEERHLIADLLKDLPFTIDGTMGLDWAVLSDGGIDLTEVDTRTMRSRLHSNLFLVGDTLHINRPSGGYSLQLCWTTGWVAGDHA